MPILAPRGKILDREGRIIVDNYPSFSVLLLRDQKRDLDADADKIAEGLHMPPDELRARLKRMAAVPGYQPLFLKDDITPDELAFIESHRAELPELDIINVHRRLYPRNGFMAHVIGYVGQVSEDMLTQPQWELYNPGDIVGMSGVEQYYNDILMGKNGSRQVLVNSRGKEVGTLSDVPAVPGKQLKLTIDLDLQIAAEEALEGRPGAIVAMDPRNGEILAMVSRPAFDPNEFAVHITRDEWNQLVTDPGKPLLNKAIQAQLAPGSVFKIIMATAGLQEGIAQDLIVNCGGGKNFLRTLLQVLDRRTAHARTAASDISKAIYQSCDSYFYTLAEKLGIGKIAKWATMLGLGQKTGIDLPQEVSGVMPSEEWKIKNFKQKWYAGETISVGIGQGAVATTPIQLARAVGAITSDGLLVRPHLAFPEQFPPGFKQVADYTDKAQIPLDAEELDDHHRCDGGGGVAHRNGGERAAAGHRFCRQDGQRADHLQRAEEEDGPAEEQVQGQRLVRGRHAAAQSGDRGGRACWKAVSTEPLPLALRRKVIKAYVEKQRTRADGGGQGNAKHQTRLKSPPSGMKATPKQPDKLQAGHFNIPTDGTAKPVAAAPGVTAGRSPEACRRTCKPPSRTPRWPSREREAPLPPPPDASDAAPQDSEKAGHQAFRSSGPASRATGHCGARRGSREPLRFLPRFRLGTAGLRAADLRPGGGGNL